MKFFFLICLKFFFWGGVILLKFRMYKYGIIIFFILKREKDTLNINIIVYTNTDTILLIRIHLTHSENKLTKRIVRN